MEKINSLRESFKSGITLDLTFRKQQLQAFHNLVTENVDELCNALYKDLHKCRHDSMMTEVHILRKDIEFLLYNLDSLAAAEKVGKTFITLTDATSILKQPYGVVCVLSAWNYPILLTLQPVVGALAAGNCVLVKPSEVSEASEKLISDLLSKYIDPRCCQVFCGGPQETAELLKQRFDYIFYTGSTQVGRLVMQAAAVHLTPVTLELGGKSPTYIDRDCYLPMSARRVIWGKFTNAGQTCIAPDYVLCHTAVYEEFLAELQAGITEFFGEKPALSPDFGRIVNERHFHRLTALLSSTKAKLVTGSDQNLEERYIAPTILRDVLEDDIIMRDEIFGPILPVVHINSEEDAIDFINKREKPLAVYVFTKSREVMQKFEKRTFSGGLVHNDTVLHCGVMGLPFGGVGESGIGQYHGKYSFDCFTHKRALLDKDTNEMVNYLLRYPPYTASKSSWMNWALSSGRGSYCSIM